MWCAGAEEVTAVLPTAAGAAVDVQAAAGDATAATAAGSAQGWWRRATGAAQAHCCHRCSRVLWAQGREHCHQVLLALHVLQLLLLLPGCRRRLLLLQAACTVWGQHAIVLLLQQHLLHVLRCLRPCCC
jgi:hypothetical protein